MVLQGEVKHKEKGECCLCCLFAGFGSRIGPRITGPGFLYCRPQNTHNNSDERKDDSWRSIFEAYVLNAVWV